MDYNNPYKFGDIVEIGLDHVRTMVIFGEFKDNPAEGILYAASDGKVLGTSIKPNNLRHIGNDTKLADKYRKRFLAKSKAGLKPLTHKV